jgi:hypothetical protein
MLTHVIVNARGHRQQQVLDAMLNNSSPAVSTFEEFETGPLPKAGWGGIPDVWFTSEIVSLARSLMIYDDLRSGLRSASDVTLLSGASHDLTVRRGLSFEHIPVKGTGCLISLKFTPLVLDAADDAHTLNGSSSDVGPERCVSCRIYNLLGSRCTTCLAHVPSLATTAMFNHCGAPPLLHHHPSPRPHPLRNASIA